MNVFIKTGIFSFIYIAIYIDYIFFIFCLLMLERQKITSGFFLFEAERKAKNGKKKKRQIKLLQSAEKMKTTVYSSSGDTTNTDEEK